jgi:hypothetical protein
MYLYLGDTVHANNSIIFATAIGRIHYFSLEHSTNGPLQCVTDQPSCCRQLNYRRGEWFFPDGTRILTIGSYGFPLFYRNRGFNGTVNLNRADINATFPTGLFCCMVPDITDISRTLCANIGKPDCTITL